MIISERVLGFRTCTPGDRHRGFTLLELVAALLLTGLLMAAALRLLQTMHDQEQILAETAQGSQPWISRVFYHLRKDFRNSRQMAIGDNAVYLAGYAGTDGIRLASDHTNAEITYDIVRTNGHSCLRRGEVSRDVLSNQNRSPRLMTIGVESLSLWFSEAPDVPWKSEGTRQLKWMPIPDSIIVEMTFHPNVVPDPMLSESIETSVPSMRIRRTLLLKPGGRQ